MNMTHEEFLDLTPAQFTARCDYAELKRETMEELSAAYAGPTAAPSVPGQPASGPKQWATPEDTRRLVRLANVGR